MKRRVLAKMEPYLYDYEQEWNDPCSYPLNKKRWKAISALRDAWVKLDASQLRRYLHKDLVYWSFSTKSKLGRDEFIAHLDKKFFLRNGVPFSGQIVNLYSGRVQLDYPYAVNLSSERFDPHSTLHIPRFKGDKIIEIYVSETMDYMFDVSYEKGMIKEASGEKAEFSLSGKLKRVFDIVSAKDLERCTINATLRVLEANGANVDWINYENKPSSVNIMIVSDGQLFVYRCDTRLRQQNGFARRTCGPLKDFTEKYATGDERWSDRASEYEELTERIVFPGLTPALAVITCDVVCVENKNALPKNGSTVNFWMVRQVKRDSNLRNERSSH